MDKTPDERLLKWLRDNHAMETEALVMLKAQASRIENYPELRQRLQEHVRETEGQAQLLETCIHRLGGSIPTAKNMIASAMATMHATGNAMLEDEVVKGMGLSYAFEHLEISAYRSLIIAAETFGDTQTADIGRRILREEEAMADWLASHLESVVRTYLRLEQIPEEEAKR